jgi:hypothetical protein
VPEEIVGRQRNSESESSNDAIVIPKCDIAAVG